jgi:amino acid transporter
MCITAGIFTVYAYALSTAGPAFVWTWPVVAAGQILVALVLAELAGRLPLSGYAFQWTSRLASSHYGWFVGWAGLMAFIPGFTGLNLGLAPILSERLGLSLSKTSILVVVVVLTLSQFLINLAGVKIASRINNVAAFTAELAASIVLTLILLVVGFIINRENSLSFLTSSEGVPTGGFLSAFLLSGLLGIWVLTGFEGAADLAEETKMARRRVPRSVVVSLLISIVIGFLMIVGLTINISDLGATLAAPVPITHLLKDALGSGGALVFEWVAMIALFAGGLANMAAASRLMFSLSRDNMLPGSRRLARVSATTHTPTGSLLTVTAISMALRHHRHLRRHRGHDPDRRHGVGRLLRRLRPDHRRRHLGRPQRPARRRQHLRPGPLGRAGAPTTRTAPAGEPVAPTDPTAPVPEQA